MVELVVPVERVTVWVVVVAGVIVFVVVGPARMYEFVVVTVGDVTVLTTELVVVLVTVGDVTVLTTELVVVLVTVGDVTVIVFVAELRVFVLKVKVYRVVELVEDTVMVTVVEVVVVEVL
jgi:hypothetical protein